MVEGNVQMPQQPQQPQQPVQPVYQAPAQALMELSGGMKFGWLVVGLCSGLIGILLAWLTNAGNVAKVRTDAVKFAAIGFAIAVVLGIFMAIAFGALAASIASSIYY